MAANSKIEWTDHTFNPWIGCTKVAAGCEHCYAESFAKRYGKAIWGPHGTRVKTSETYWRQPLKWNRESEERVARGEERAKVFCASLADVFEDWDGWVLNHTGHCIADCQDCGGRILGEGMLPPHCGTCGSDNFRLATLETLRRNLFALVDATPHLDWLLLSKRPENIHRMWRAVNINSQQRADDRNERGELYRRNVWLLTSIATQADADRNIPELLKCRDLVPVLGLSCEPLLGPIDIIRTMKPTDRDWEEFHDRTCDAEGWEEPEEFIEECEEECDYINYGRQLVHSSEHREWEYDRQRFAQRIALKRSIDWIICGGESGPHARPMHPDWVRSLRDQCQAAGVPFFFKQGSQTKEWPAFKDFESFPPGTQVREFPLAQR